MTLAESPNPTLTSSILYLDGISVSFDGYKALQRAQFGVIDRRTVGIILLDQATKVVFAMRLHTLHGHA